MPCWLQIPAITTWGQYAAYLLALMFGIGTARWLGKKRYGTLIGLAIVVLIVVMLAVLGGHGLAGTCG